jgi:hypothetical protein
MIVKQQFYQLIEIYRQWIEAKELITLSLRQVVVPRNRVKNCQPKKWVKKASNWGLFYS